MSVEKTVSFGLWCDDPPSVVLTADYMDAVKAMGITELAVMIDDWRKRWKPRWTLRQMERLVAMADVRGISLCITDWPYPDRAYIDKMYFCADDALRHYLQLAPSVIRSEESDLEMNWKRKHTKGFRRVRNVPRTPFDFAGDHLSEVKHDLLRENGLGDLNVEVTTFPGHSELTSGANVSLNMDAIYIQAYGVRSRGPKGNKRYIGWDHKYGPNRMQDFAYQKAVDADLTKCVGTDIMFGLPVWNLKWPGQTRRSAFKLQLYSALRLSRPRAGSKHIHIRLWSSKWVVGVRKRQQMADVLNDILPVLAQAA